MRLACPLCGKEGLSQFNYGQHMNSGPCRVDATRRSMKERGWARLGSAYQMCKRVGIEMERAPTRYRSGGDARGRVQMGWWAPRWVLMIISAPHMPMAEREGLLRHAQTDLSFRQEYIDAFEIVDALE